MHDFCLIQEHWLLYDRLNSLNFLSDVLSVAVSGMDDTDLILGRPFGGCCIIYRKSLPLALGEFTHHLSTSALYLSLCPELVIIAM